jgi:apolipoprotein N-acyltransferase
VIAFLAGAASVAAFAPLGVYPLLILTSAALAYLWSAASPRRALITGWWFGLGLFGAGVSWIYVSLHNVGGMPAIVAGLATLIFCAFLALFPAVAGWLQARIPAGPAVRACLLIPAAWTLFEWIRSWILTGFPWLSFGYASAGWPLQGFAPVGGVFLLSFITVALGGMAWLIVKRRWYWIGAFAVLVVAGES